MSAGISASALYAAYHIQLGHVMMLADRVHCECGRTLYAFLEKR